MEDLNLDTLEEALGLISSDASRGNNWYAVVAFMEKHGGPPDRFIIQAAREYLAGQRHGVSVTTEESDTGTVVNFE